MVFIYFGLIFLDLGKINGQLFYCVGQEIRKIKINVQINGSVVVLILYENICLESKLDFFFDIVLCFQFFFLDLLLFFLFYIVNSFF